MLYIPWLRIQSSASPNHLEGLCGGQEPSALRRHLGTPSHSTAVCSVDRQEKRIVNMTVPGVWGRAVGRQRWPWLQPSSCLLSVHQWR